MKRYSIVDYKKRKKFKKVEWKYNIFRFFFKGINLAKADRLLIFNYKCRKLFQDNLMFKNRCIYNYNPRSVPCFLRVNTLRLKEFYFKNLIPGIRKSSW